MERKQEEVKFGGAAMSLQADLSCLQGGGAEAEEGLAMLEKQLICPICLEVFNKPVVILPCQHNLCRKCANELYQPSLLQARTTMMVNSGRFRCPSCRHEVVLDRHGVYGLQRNLLVENIIDVYKQQVSNNNNNNATSSLPPAAPPAQATCSDHEGEKVNIYCLTCQVPTCSLCKVFGAHQSCQVAPLSDIYQQQKDELSEEISSLVAVNGNIQALINELEETCRNIEENSRTQKQSVCEKFNHVFSILEERQKVMTQRISSEQDEKTSHAQVLVCCYGDSMEANNKLVERAKSSMEEEDMAAFVQSSRELITKVLAASASCPADTLKPGYESLSHYRYDFSRQESALKSIDFLKVVEDVPEEPEVEQEPEEPKEPFVQNIEPKPHQETSSQNLPSVAEPVKESIPALISPPVEPVQTPTSTPVPPAPGPAPAPAPAPAPRYPVEAAGAVLQAETDDPGLNDGESGQKKEEEEEKKEAEGCEVPGPVKEENSCEQQEGMSTQQRDGGEAGRETEEKHDSQEKDEEEEEEEEEEEDTQMKEEIDAVFYPSWYKLSSWSRVSPVPAEQKMCSPQPAGDSLFETEASAPAPAASKPRMEPQPPWSLDPHPDQPPPGPQQVPQQVPHQSENQSQPQPQEVPVGLGSASIPAPQLGPTMQETGGEAGVTEDEEEDMQGWVCLPAAVSQAFSRVETSLDLAECSLDSFSDNNNNDSPSYEPPEERETDRDNVELSDGRLEAVEHHDEDNLDLGFISKPEVRGGLGDCGAGAMMDDRLEKGSVRLDERSKVQRNELSGLEKESSEPKNGVLDVDDGMESITGSIEGEGGAGFSEKKDDDGEISEQPEDFNKKTETNATETEEKRTFSDCLQAVTLLFYLLAFLVILQRFWAYIGCFICT